MKNHVKRLYELMRCMVMKPRSCARAVSRVPAVCDAYGYARSYAEATQQREDRSAAGNNPFVDYLKERKDSRGVWKWEHYYEVYHRHFARFIGHDVNILEVGVYSGGSLEMWHAYFGDQSQIYGVDINPACKSYEAEHIDILIGDQADRRFWGKVKGRVHELDIVIDDGGHSPEQQRVTLEEMLPVIRPGGIYICEDIHGVSNEFAAYATGLVYELNGGNSMPGAALRNSVEGLQSVVHSIHFYPYILVIEKHRDPPTMLSAPRHGTEWQPYLQ